VNTLSITITSDDRFLEAVRLEGTVTTGAPTSVAEPASLVLGSISLVVGAGCWWRRRRRARA
jgi:hypothetical protein